jgi:hypothetical protein
MGPQVLRWDEEFANEAERNMEAAQNAEFKLPVYKQSGVTATA